MQETDYLNNVFSKTTTTRTTHSNADSKTQTSVNSGHAVTTGTIPYIRGTSETIALVLYNLTIYLLNTNRQSFYDDYLLMLRTKTNRRTDREQYTKSNAATARLLIGETGRNLSTRLNRTQTNDEKW